MHWRELRTFRDASVPKLANLMRARRADIAVPPTVWAPASDAPELPPGAIHPPWMVRSASPDEDGAASSQAGRFHSEGVHDPAEFAGAVRRVVASVGGRGVVFVQPLATPEYGGVVFSDGFYFEQTEAEGGNRKLTAGEDRGSVVRGHVDRSGAWSEWLAALHRTFPEMPVIDAEYARDGDDYLLLQARPAAFGVRRNELLSLANHREILGDPPSPWLVSALAEAGAEATRYFAEVDSSIERWREPYAVSLSGRAWLNFSFFFRLMDHWGLPRTFVTEGVGGSGEGPDGGSLIWRKVLRSAPALIRLQWKNRRTIRAASGALQRWINEVRTAESLDALFDATVSGLVLALRTNFAINGALSGVSRVRRALRIPGRAEVVTEHMRRKYEALRRLPPEQRETGLAGWLAEFGHRGPLESDPCQPRFRELRAELLHDLRDGTDSPLPPVKRSPRWTAPFFRLDRRREWFRDALMRGWEELRSAILREAARSNLAEADQVFCLDRSCLGQPELAAERKRHWREAGRQSPPGTATRDAIVESLRARDGAQHPGRLTGIALHDTIVTGRVRKARTLDELLRSDTPLDGETILVVPALEPAWGIYFGRVAGVVAELGGELSHASILLREARTPALVNCAGVFSAIEDGQRVRLDGTRAELIVEAVAAASP